jgi:hypothetical protein
MHIYRLSPSRKVGTESALTIREHMDEHARHRCLKHSLRSENIYDGGQSGFLCEKHHQRQSLMRKRYVKLTLRVFPVHQKLWRDRTRIWHAWGYNFAYESMYFLVCETWASTNQRDVSTALMNEVRRNYTHSIQILV